MDDRSYKYLKKQKKLIGNFSAHLMSNNKWFKLFFTLAEHHNQITKCFMVNIYDDVKRPLEIPSITNFSITFDDKGILDGGNSGGPILFKEIRWLEFPSVWYSKRRMRTEVLQPITYYQDIAAIEQLAKQIGLLTIELDEQFLKIYGYK